MPQPVQIPPEQIRAALPVPALQAAAVEVVRLAALGVQERGTAGLPTGLPTLDANMGGLQSGLHIVAAEPGAGKTALALTIARNAAAKRLPVVYASFDETPERLVLKTLAARAGFCFSDLVNGRGDPEAVAQAFTDHAPHLAALSFVHADARLTPAELIDQLKAQLEHWKESIGLLVVDYLQPWAAAMASQSKTDLRVAVGAMALELRKVALDTRCPVLMVSAQNRQGQGSASMTSLRESSDLEYGADTIMLLTNDEAAAVGSGQYGRSLKLAKNRFGPAGLTVPLVLEARSQVIRERK